MDGQGTQGAPPLTALSLGGTWAGAEGGAPGTWEEHPVKILEVSSPDLAPGGSQVLQMGRIPSPKGGPFSTGPTSAH